MPPPTTPAPALPADILEEIFLRLPPDEPECLVRASLASKFWLAHLSSPSFRSWYRDLHGAPPMLGFVYGWPYYVPKKNNVPRFVSTGKFSPRFPQDKDNEYDVWDCRHGRVLLGDTRLRKGTSLFVWDPMTGQQRELEKPQELNNYGAAVLCDSTGCDHRACHHGPFRVVLVAMDSRGYGDSVANVWVCSLDVIDCNKQYSGVHIDEWGEVFSGFHIPADVFIVPCHHVIVEDALHFILVYVDDGHLGILKYALISNCFSVIEAPLNTVYTSSATILMAMEDGSLGFAYEDGLTLYLWSRQLGSNGVASWTDCKLINLRELLPIQNPRTSLRLIGSVEGSDSIFVTTDLGIYDINLKTLLWKKLWGREAFVTIIPYMSFYNPQERARPGKSKDDQLGLVITDHLC